MSPIAILFISHTATRSGAPIVLLHFLRWLKAKKIFSLYILLGIGGELEEEFKAIAPTYILEKYLKEEQLFNTSRINKTKQKLAGYFGLKIGNAYHNLYCDLKHLDIQLIYANTATNGQLLEELSPLNCPVISHIHELEYAIQFFGKKQFNQVKSRTTHFIACSNAVSENLIKNHEIEPEKITIIHEFINDINIPLKAEVLRKELDLPENVFIVGASGNLEWRKGCDLFVQLAYLVRKRRADSLIHFVWIGGDQNSKEYLGLSQDTEKLGVKEFVHFISSKINPLTYYIGFDVFTLMSREDPFPLVCLEAGLLGKPILCFDKAGGEPEFVEDDCGKILPYLDLEEMANHIIQLYHSKADIQIIGEKATQKVRDNYLVEKGAPKILQVLERLLDA